MNRINEIQDIDPAMDIDTKNKLVKAIYNRRYRDKHPEVYRQKNLERYYEMKESDEWKERRNARRKVIRELRNQALLEQGIEVRKRGRPREY
jgi:hypothetical protein